MPSFLLQKSTGELEVVTGPLPLTATPLSGPGTYEIFALGAVPTQVNVGYTAPTLVNTLGDVTYGAQSGVIEIPAAGAFAGFDLTFSLTSPVPGVTINGATGVVSLSTQTPGILSITVQASNPAGDISTGFTATIEAASGTAPQFSVDPSISPSSGAPGTVFTLDEGIVLGNPTPQVAMTLTLDGVDVTNEITPQMTYAPASEGLLLLSVTAQNGTVPDANAQSSAVVTNTQTGPQLPAFLAEPRMHLSGSIHTLQIPVGATVIVDPGTWWGGVGHAPTVTPRLYRAGQEVTLTPNGALYEFVADEPGALVFTIEATNGAGTTAYDIAGEITATDARATFGELTPVGQGALDTNDHPSGPLSAGTYGEFVVDGAGIARPNTSPLTVGTVTHGGIDFVVVRNAITTASLSEHAAAFNRPDATLAAAGGKAGLQIMMRANATQWDIPGSNQNNKFLWHSGLPCVLTSADPANITSLGLFGVTSPNLLSGNVEPSTQGKVHCVGLRFFSHCTTRTEAHGQIFINQYDEYNTWNLNPRNISTCDIRGANWVEDIGFSNCVWASDYQDLKQVPVSWFPDEEIGGLSLGRVRRAWVIGCTAEHLHNGFAVSGDEVYCIGNEQRFCHGDMFRPRPIQLIGAGLEPSSKIMMKDNLWHQSTGDNFRHPDFIHAFSLGQIKGWDGCVMMGNRAMTDVTTLLQPPKATGLHGTLLWQSPQSGAVTLPAQNASAFLLDDSGGAVTATLRPISTLPTPVAIDGFYGAGAIVIALTKTDADWQTGDTFVFDGVTHTLGSQDSGGNWSISPGLNSAPPGGFGIITSNSRMSQGASFTTNETAGATSIDLTVPYGAFMVGDTFSIGSVNYRIDTIPSGGGTGTYTITPELKADATAGQVLDFNINMSVQRLGPQGSGITLEGPVGEPKFVKNGGQPQQPLQTQEIGGAWAEYFLRLDLVNKRWLVNQSGNTAYQGIFSGIDPSEGYDNTQIAANLIICPGKMIEFGFDTRPSIRSEAVANAGSYPWPGDVDGDFVLNTLSDGKKIDAPAAKNSIGGVSTNIQTFRLMGNVAGNASITGSAGGVDLIPLNYAHGDTVDKINDFATMSDIFQGAALARNDTWVPDAASLVDDLRPVANGPTHLKGLGCLGANAAEDLYDFATGRWTRDTPWDVVNLEANPDLNSIAFSWYEPAVLHRESLFGASLPHLAMEFRYSTDGGTNWSTPVPALGSTQVDGKTTVSGSYTVTGLAPGTDVIGQARALNANGWGVWTPLASRTTEIGQAVRSQDAPLVLTPQSGPNLAMVIAVSYASSAAASRVDEIVINGQTMPTLISNAVAQRGAALLVLREADLAGFSGDLTIVPQWTGQPSSSYDLVALTVTGIDQTASLTTALNNDNFNQSLTLTGSGAALAVGTGVSATTVDLTTPATERLRTDSQGGHSLLFTQETTGAQTLSTETGATWGILLGARLPRV